MSNRSSVLDESFLERKSGSMANTSGAAVKGGFGAGSVPVGEVSPFQSINRLVESPFQRDRFERDSYRGREKSECVGFNYDDSVLRRKVRAYQKRFEESVKAEEPVKVDPKTYLQSAFGCKRGTLERRERTSRDGDGDGDGAGYTTTRSTLSRDINDPYFTEALGRIVNKELELRRLLFTVLLFAVMRFVRSLVRLFVYTHPAVGEACDAVAAVIERKTEGVPFGAAVGGLFTFESILVEASYVDTGVSAVLLFVVARSAYRLLKPQDRCLDLPLSAAQRKVLGLEVVEVEGEVEGEDVQDTVEQVHASPQRMEQPVQVVVPDIGSLDTVVGSLGGLDLRGSSTGTSTGMNITPSGKYMYETRSSRSFY